MHNKPGHSHNKSADNHAIVVINCTLCLSAYQAFRIYKALICITRTITTQLLPRITSLYAHANKDHDVHKNKENEYSAIINNCINRFNSGTFTNNKLGKYSGLTLHKSGLGYQANISKHRTINQ